MRYFSRFLCYFRPVFKRKLINNKFNPKVHHISTVSYQKPILKYLFPAWMIMYAASLENKEKTSNTKAQQNQKNLITKVDLLYKEMKYEDIYELLYPERLSENDEILWRLARVTYELRNQTSSKTDYNSQVTEAYDYVVHALELNENNNNVHRWCAILLDAVAVMKGTKERLIRSIASRKHMEKAIELCPTDATAHYMIGYWCYTFADLPWYQRKMASIIFTAPPSSTFNEALQYFEKAEELEPNFYSLNLLMLGKTYLKLNQKEKAIIALEKVKNYNVRTRDDKDAYKEAVELLKSIQV